MHDDALQLQFALGAMIAGFAAHHIYLPFDATKIAKGTHFLDEDKRGEYVGQGMLLHHLERNSIIVCSLLLWSATVFTMRVDCSGVVWGFCSLVVLVVFVSNIVFLASGVYYFVRFFLKRTKLLEHVMTEIRRRASSFDPHAIRKTKQARRSTQENPIANSVAELSIPNIISGHAFKSAAGHEKTKKSRGRGGRGRSNSGQRPEALPKDGRVEMIALGMGASMSDY